MAAFWRYCARNMVAFCSARMDLRLMQNDHAVNGESQARADLSLMQHEMRFVLGTVPARIEGAFFDDEEGFSISNDEILFTTWDDVRFHYCRGEGLTVQMPDGDGETDFELFLWGTVFGAVAWLNGLVPLHASAVDIGGHIVAFTADSGGGKSTLAAAMAAYGHPHVCDDTLVLSLQPGCVYALPDSKSLKLWGDALQMTSIEAGRPVPSMPGKHYAAAACKAEAPLPLTDLVFLERGDEVTLEPVTGAAKLALLPGALYRGFVHVARGDRAAHEQFLLQFCAGVRFWTLRRPFDSLRFGTDVEVISQLLRSAHTANNP
ncbi:hypothetical protein [Novosphingobium sp. MMS21-SN21R]|uniref:hypothetical protein n=1 Tax=Novosphingobium sp. MMS21-SN21R TaxID=2969298 RepID=UPI002885F547|nr:hypothetical protein [Novosphingobium sp. MMS21-SN21R]MDT0509378.1 hypothetical protein [Novosphingobium sp. MMS21-SN21R]